MAKHQILNQVSKNILLFLQKSFNSNRLAANLENKFISNKKFSPPPIFIIGLPRSGTTLLYQLLIDTYRFAYFNNISNYFFTSPVLLSYISLKIFGYYKPIDYRSQFGLTPGISSPSESGFIFRNWFNNNDNKKKIRQSVFAISNVYKAPFIAKNLYNNFRIEVLNKLFPNSVFIEVRRDLKFIGQSLLLGRKKETGSYNEWFGVKPLNYEEIKKIKDPFEQVSCQISTINKTIEKSLKGIETNRKIIVSYEELCDNPDFILKQLIHFFDKNSIKPEKIRDIHSPIKNSNNIRLPKNEWDKLCKYL